MSKAIYIPKNEFRRCALKPLERAFDIQLYFNGQTPWCAQRYKEKLYLGSHYAGRAYGNCRDVHFAIIQWSTKNYLWTVFTLAHEIAHLELHYDPASIGLPKALKETEAVEAGIDTLIRLGIPVPDFYYLYYDYWLKKAEPWEPRYIDCAEVARKIESVKLANVYLRLTAKAWLEKQEVEPLLETGYTQLTLFS